MGKPFDHLKELGRKVLGRGVEAAAREEATERFEDDQALSQRILRAAGETFDLADQFAADGDPHKKEFAALIKDRVMGTMKDGDAERHRAEGAREPLEASPFAGNSRPSAANSTPSGPSLPASPPAASLPGPTGQPKKRGRPPKRSNG